MLLQAFDLSCEALGGRQLLALRTEDRPPIAQGVIGAGAAFWLPSYLEHVRHLTGEHRRLHGHQVGGRFSADYILDFLGPAPRPRGQSFPALTAGWLRRSAVRSARRYQRCPSSLYIHREAGEAVALRTRRVKKLWRMPKGSMARFRQSSTQPASCLRRVWKLEKAPRH